MSRKSGVLCISILACGLFLAEMALRKSPPVLIADRSRLQETETDCGAACLQLILRGRGIDVTLEEVRRLTGTTQRGTSLLSLSRTARLFGLGSQGWRLGMEDLRTVPLPVILFVDGHHFVVLQRFERGDPVISDPAVGELRMTSSGLASRWDGIALVFGDWEPCSLGQKNAIPRRSLSNVGRTLQVAAQRGGVQ